MDTVALVLVGLANLGLADKTPEAEDVTAGAWGALMFGLLVIAALILFRSFLKQMRRADAAKRAGVYGDPPADEQSPSEPVEARTPPRGGE